jgi:ABC-type sugar transport system permease subunit
MMAVAIVHFAVFFLYVNINSFLMPFQNADGMWTLDNIKLVLSNLSMGAQSEIVKNLKNTLIYYAVGIMTQFPLSFFFAYCLYRKVLGYKIFNVIFMIPMMVSTVVLVAVYKNLLSAGGPVSVLWERVFGKQAPFFLYDERTATASIVVYVIWTSFGLNLIIYAGAMSRIPPELWEQSRLDGVGFMRGMTTLAFPLIWPTFSIMLLLSAGGILSGDGPILLFSGGMYGTSTLGYWMYENVVLKRLYNYASALGVFMTLVSLPVFLLVVHIRKRLPDDIQY